MIRFFHPRSNHPGCLAMRLPLISILFLSLLAGCAYIGPHRIDVQQGNALDSESIARLKPGLSRSQVRFLLGTPLVVDPFRTDRWDYVYLYYRAGTLVEQKHISLFFDGDTLSRIEGDVPPAVPAAPVPATVTPAVVETQPAPAVAAPVAAPTGAQQPPPASPDPAAVDHPVSTPDGAKP
jgi:outer membrane protein assembly factor BamE